MKRMVILLSILVGGTLYGNEMGAGGGSSYPAGIDTDTSLETPLTEAREDVPNDTNDAVVKMETELGVTPKGGHATVRARLDAVTVSTVALAASTGTIAASTQTLAVNVGLSTMTLLPLNGSRAMTGPLTMGASSVTTPTIGNGTANMTIPGMLTTQSSVTLQNGAFSVGGTTLATVGGQIHISSYILKASDLTTGLELYPSRFTAYAGNVGVYNDAVAFAPQTPGYKLGYATAPWSAALTTSTAQGSHTITATFPSNGGQMYIAPYTGQHSYFCADADLNKESGLLLKYAGTPMWWLSRQATNKDFVIYNDDTNTSALALNGTSNALTLASSVTVTNATLTSGLSVVGTGDVGAYITGGAGSSSALYFGTASYPQLANIIHSPGTGYIDMGQNGGHLSLWGATSYKNRVIVGGAGSTVPQAQLDVIDIGGAGTNSSATQWALRVATSATAGELLLVTTCAVAAPAAKVNVDFTSTTIRNVQILARRPSTAGTLVNMEIVCSTGPVAVAMAGTTVITCGGTGFCNVLVSGGLALTVVANSSNTFTVSNAGAATTFFWQAGVLP